MSHNINYCPCCHSERWPGENLHYACGTFNERNKWKRTEICRTREQVVAAEVKLEKSVRLLRRLRRAFQNKLTRQQQLKTLDEVQRFLSQFPEPGYGGTAKTNL